LALRPSISLEGIYKLPESRDSNAMRPIESHARNRFGGFGNPRRQIFSMVWIQLKANACRIKADARANPRCHGVVLECEGHGKLAKAFLTRASFRTAASLLASAFAGGFPKIGLRLYSL
jgi:hypothetical protein